MYKMDGFALSPRVTVFVISACPRQLQGDSLPWWPLLSVMDGGIVEGLVGEKKKRGVVRGQEGKMGLKGSSGQ